MHIGSESRQRLKCSLFSLILTLLLSFEHAAQAETCEQGGVCNITNGYYLATAPEDWDGQRPLALIVFFHGWNSSPERMMRNTAMRRSVHARDALLVFPYAPNGYWRQIGEGRAEHGRDELAYAQALVSDIRNRWPIDHSRTLASGFSRGASMVWNLACYGGDLFQGFAPIAGAFWHSLPEDCPSGPVNLRHIHGRSDGEVAYDRRGIYNSVAVTSSLEFLERIYACSAPDIGKSDGKLHCTTRDRCLNGVEISSCLHDGGHSLPAEWVAEGLDWLVSLSRVD